MSQDRAEKSLVINLNEETNKDKCVCMKNIFSFLFINKNFLNTNSNANNYITFFVITLSIWSVIYSIHPTYALPDGIIFPIWVLWVLGIVFGYLVSKLKLPGMLGTSSFNLINQFIIPINSDLKECLLLA